MRIRTALAAVVLAAVAVLPLAGVATAEPEAGGGPDAAAPPRAAALDATPPELLAAGLGGAAAVGAGYLVVRRTPVRSRRRTR